jgi:predicted phage terminase large subunit-like protein
MGVSIERILLHENGPALWPERYSEADLIEIRNTIGEYFFAALFDGDPVPKTGGMFQAEWFRQNVIDMPAPPDAQRVRFWDLAASEGKGDYTVGLLMAAPSGNGPFIVEELIRGQWGVEKVDELVLQTARFDRQRFPSIKIRGEQEPGRSGKKAVEAFVKMLAGYDVQCELNSGSKADRARPLASQAGIGNVKLVRGPWIESFISELALFPRGKHDDIVDAASGALNILALGPEPPGPCAVGGKMPSMVGMGNFALGRF